ncbi:MAG: energy transducer TonB [bacterium]
MRIERARALAAAHQLEPAVNELESIRTTTHDDVVRNVTSVMLMSICLEEGNYARAGALLEEAFRARSTQNDASIRTYFALAGQAVNGARTHIARYRSFGINVTDAGLPAEALGDLDRLRVLLERMIAQAKEIARDEPRAYESLALLEDVLGIRLSLARNDEDRTRWEAEYAGARRGLASSETQVASLGGMPNLTSTEQETPATPASVASLQAPSVRQNPAPPKVSKPEPSAEPQPSVPSNDRPAKEPAAPPSGSPNGAKSTEPPLLDTGSLNARAIKRVLPSYPQMAKAAAAQGRVRVYVTLDETGRVIDISRSEGPGLLKAAAENAARRWVFSAIEVDGKSVRVAGYIDFNFTL